MIVHELSIAQSLIEVATREAERVGAVRATRLVCRIGALRQVDDVLLQEAFRIARQGTMCQEGSLSIEKTYVQALCPRCDARFPVRNWEWDCPACGTEGLDPIGGDELELITIEAEMPDEDRCPAECV